MENFLELDEIVLLPANRNLGFGNLSNVNFKVKEVIQRDRPSERVREYFPIFTSPNSSIIDSSERVLGSFDKSGIRPIIPQSEPCDIRYKMCKYVFSSFNLEETKYIFLNNYQKVISELNNGEVLYINIDNINGHDNRLFAIGSELKNIYADRIILMGGNIGCPEVYSDYSRAGFDYIRVGIASCSFIDSETYGFHFPMASLLEGIKQFKRTSGVGLKNNPKIIADGGIYQPSDIIKALALGADYVMCGRSFASVVEAAGDIYKKSRPNNGNNQSSKIDPSTLYNVKDLRSEGLYRQYFSSFNLDIKAKLSGYNDMNSWRSNYKNSYVDVRNSKTQVDVDKTLSEWIEEFEQCAYYAFVMSGSTNWDEFRTKIRYGSINR